jgi:hypothetical protein
MICTHVYFLHRFLGIMPLFGAKWDPGTGGLLPAVSVMAARYKSFDDCARNDGSKV